MHAWLEHDPTCSNVLFFSIFTLLLFFTWSTLSRPICDPIQKELEGLTKDRPAYWNAFARWISLHQYYIIDGDTYKKGIQCHTNTTSSYKRSTSDYGWNTNRNSNDIHPASPGCQPGTYPLIEEAEEELQNKQTSLSRHDLRKTYMCNCCCSNLWATRTQQSHYHGYQD